MFRVTQQSLLQFGQSQATRHNAQILQLQAQVSSGLRIQRPSDDPAGQGLLLRQKSLVQQLETKSSAVDALRTRLNTAHQSVLDAQTLLTRAKSIALEARQETDPDAARILADEVDVLLKQLQNIANSKVQGTAVFGGADLGADPFAFDPSTSQSVYQGSLIAGVGRLDGEPALTIQPVGADVFQQGTSRLQPAFRGSTGAAAGMGTNSARGTAVLTVRHTATSFAGASGVQAGLSSADDTILGPAGAHQLTINDTSGTGASGTISLNGGPPVAFSSSDTDLVVTGPRGEVVHVNTTAITAGFNGTVDLTADGTLSIDGGATEVPITFGTNDAVRDSRDGSVIYVDSSQIRTTGTDQIDLAGTADAFQILAQLRDDLRNTQGLSATDRDAAIGRRLDDLDRMSMHLLSVASELGLGLERLDAVQSRTEQLLLDARGHQSEIEETDYPQAILELQSRQLQVQFSLATASRLVSVSVLDFLS